MADRDDEHRVEPASGASAPGGEPFDAIHDDDELAEALAKQLERFAPSGPIPVQRPAVQAGRVLQQPPIPAGDRPIAVPPLRRGSALPAQPVVSPVLRPVRPIRPAEEEPALRPVARIHPSIGAARADAARADDEPPTAPVRRATVPFATAERADPSAETTAAAVAPAAPPAEHAPAQLNGEAGRPTAVPARHVRPAEVMASPPGSSAELPEPDDVATGTARPVASVEESELAAGLCVALDPADFEDWAASLQAIGRDDAPADTAATPAEVARLLGATLDVTHPPVPSTAPALAGEPAAVTAPVRVPQPLPADAAVTRPTSIAFLDDADDEVPVTTGELAAFESGAVATGSIPLITAADVELDADDDADDARTDVPAKPAGLVSTGEMPVLVAGRPATGAIPIVAVPFTPAGRAGADPRTAPVDAVPVEKQASGFWQIGVWAAVSTGAPAILAGGALVLAGLSLPQAVTAVVLGALLHGLLSALPVAFGAASGRGGETLLARVIGTAATRFGSLVAAVLRLVVAAAALWVVGRAAGRWSVPLTATGSVDTATALVALLLAALVVGALAGAPGRVLARTLAVVGVAAVAAAAVVLVADAGTAGFVASAESASAPLGVVISGVVLVAAVGGFGVVGSGADIGRRARSGGVSGSAAFLGAALPVVLLGGFGVLATAPAASLLVDGLVPTGTSVEPLTAIALLVLAVVAPMALATVASTSAARAVRVAAPSIPLGGAVAIVVLAAVGVAASLAALDLTGEQVLALLVVVAPPAAALAGALGAAALLGRPAPQLHVPAISVLVVAVVLGSGLTDGLGDVAADGWLYSLVGADPATRPALAGIAVALLLGAIAPLLPSGQRASDADAAAVRGGRRSVDSTG